MDLAAAIQQESSNPLLLAGTALILGALHGLEPGHSKTMMAAFIIAVKGTVTQAIMLGVSAALSHSLIVWGLALVALQFGDELIGDTMEPYFIMGSGVLVIIISFWMFMRMLKLNAQSDHHHDHSHHHSHDDGAANDAHARGHATAIKSQFSDGKTTMWQTILFGLTGGLIPCSAAITVLILCLHLGKLSLGVGLVAAFSAGLALTFIAVGVTVSVGMRFAAERTNKLESVFRNAPYVSAVIVAGIGVAMTYSGYAHLGGNV